MSYPEFTYDFSTRSILDCKYYKTDALRYFNSYNSFGNLCHNGCYDCCLPRDYKKAVRCSPCCEKMNPLDPCIKYNPYFNIYNTINASGAFGCYKSPCDNQYCTYYKKPWLRFKCCDAKNQSKCIERIYSKLYANCNLDYNRCYQKPMISFNKFLMQFLVQSPCFFNTTDNSICDYECKDKVSYDHYPFSKSISIPQIDTKLINPSGLTVQGDIIWVADTGNGLITSYDLNGKILPQTISVQTSNLNMAHPTNVLYNSGPGFVMTNGNITEAATLLITTQEGTINGYNPNVSNVAYVLFDNSANNSYYTGLATNGINLYVCDLYNNRIDVFGPDFTLLNSISSTPFSLLNLIPISPSTSTTTSTTANNYTIFVIENQIYVCYVHVESNNTTIISGRSLGYINLFSIDGTFITTFISQGVINNPSFISFAPPSFGFPVGSFIVGNLGDGIFNVFDSNKNLIGKLTSPNLDTLRINGFKTAITVNNLPNTIYFVSAPNSGNSGLLGAISLNPCC